MAAQIAYYWRTVPGLNQRFMTSVYKSLVEALGTKLMIVPDQVRTMSQIGTSSYVAYAMWELMQGVPIWLEKFLLGPIVKESLVHAVSRLLIHLLHVFESEFASGVKDVTTVLIYIRFMC